MSEASTTEPSALEVVSGILWLATGLLVVVLMFIFLLSGMEHGWADSEQWLYRAGVVEAFSVGFRLDMQANRRRREQQ